MIESLKNLYTNLKNTKNYRLVIAGILLFLFLVVVLVIFTNRSEQQAPEFIPFYGPAVLLDAESFILELNNYNQLETIREDIKYFARETISEYQEGDIEVLFRVEGFTITQSSIQLTGVFEAVNKRATINANKINYNKLVIEIATDVQSSSSIALPSKSPKNQFIGSLPQTTDSFKVDYLERSDSFYVTFSQVVNKDVLEEAKIYLKDKLNTQNLSDYTISAIGFTEQDEIKSFNLSN
jgi:hypothetical protein